MLLQLRRIVAPPPVVSRRRARPPPRQPVARAHERRPAQKHPTIDHDDLLGPGSGRAQTHSAGSRARIHCEYGTLAAAARHRTPGTAAASRGRLVCGNVSRSTTRRPRLLDRDLLPAARRASGRTGIVSTRRSCGTSTPARRSSSACRPTASPPTRACSASISTAASGRRSSSRPAAGKARAVSVHGHWWAAPSRRAFNSTASRWRRPAGRRAERARAELAGEVRVCALAPVRPSP